MIRPWKKGKHLKELIRDCIEAGEIPAADYKFPAGPLSTTPIEKGKRRPKPDPRAVVTFRGEFVQADVFAMDEKIGCACRYHHGREMGPPMSHGWPLEGDPPQPMSREKGVRYLKDMVAGRYC